MKGGSKKTRQTESANIVAHRRHSVVVDFLSQEPFASRLLSIVPEGSKKVLLTKLLASKEPVLGKQIAANTRWTDGAFWPAAQRLNEYLEAFSQGTSCLKNNGIVIKIPIGSRGGHKFGYYLACFDAQTKEYLDAQRAIDVLGAAVRERWSGAPDSALGQLSAAKEPLAGSHTRATKSPGLGGASENKSSTDGQMLIVLDGLTYLRVGELLSEAPSVRREGAGARDLYRKALEDFVFAAMMFDLLGVDERMYPSGQGGEEERSVLAFLSNVLHANVDKKIVKIETKGDYGILERSRHRCHILRDVRTLEAAGFKYWIAHVRRDTGAYLGNSESLHDNSLDLSLIHI